MELLLKMAVNRNKSVVISIFAKIVTNQVVINYYCVLMNTGKMVIFGMSRVIGVALKAYKT